MTWFTYSKILLCTVSCRNYFLSAVYIRQPERGLRVAEITAQLTNVYILSKCGPGGAGAVAALGDILCSPRAWQENNGLFVSHWWYSTTEQARNQSLEIIQIQNVCIFKKVFFNNNVLMWTSNVWKPSAIYLVKTACSRKPKIEPQTDRCRLRFHVKYTPVQNEFNGDEGIKYICCTENVMHRTPKIIPALSVISASEIQDN